ncbi:aminoacyl-histidine dipeptidase [Rhodanobacter aciditrophus]|uniref:Aminoacyl-histidine dipeptidase n=1 Tax=Rhodanobacter aciditrophus TaxID=1623218 RepID=A0ABW4B3P9_9GAMM
MNAWLDTLAPESVWTQFRLMCDTPRPSFHEKKLRDHLIAWAKAKNLTSFVDEVGNLFILKDATAGMEHCETTVLQGHLDMVAQKEANSSHNFETDPLETYEQDGWVHARGTTLGADNGIGVAAILAVLAAEDIPHGPIEALFTIEEETSLRGAAQLAPGVLKGTRLLNLDSEDRGDVYIGCAGGIDINVAHKYPAQRTELFDTGLQVTVSGLKGGHSGLDIHKGLANANVLLTRLLSELAEQISFGLGSFEGGTLRNAIARDAKATIALAKDQLDQASNLVKGFAEVFAAEFADTDPNLTISVVPAPAAPHLPEAEQVAFLQALSVAPNGVHRMSPVLSGVTETSCNFGVVRLLPEGSGLSFSACLLVRSLVDSQTDYLARVAASPFELIGCDVLLENGYPGWKPQPDQGLLKQFNEIHQQVMGFAPNVKVIHAGLECGIIGAKYPAMEMVSFGPNIRGAHSPSERLEIASVAEFWELLKALLLATPRVRA